MRRLVLLPGLMLLAQLAAAELPTGRKQVTLTTADGRSLRLGTLVIERSDEQYRFAFTLDEVNFSEHFLSMRPFQCIGGEPMYCHLDYPYRKANTISATDLVDLEYEFLFIVRAVGEYGIDPYNGRYYVLRPHNGGFAGELWAVDLNLLAAPPAAGVTRPIVEADLDFIELESERFPRLSID